MKVQGRCRFESQGNEWWSTTIVRPTRLLTAHKYTSLGHRNQSMDITAHANQTPSGPVASPHGRVSIKGRPHVPSTGARQSHTARFRLAVLDYFASTGSMALVRTKFFPDIHDQVKWNSKRKRSTFGAPTVRRPCPSHPGCSAAAVVHFATAPYSVQKLRSSWPRGLATCDATASLSRRPCCQPRRWRWPRKCTTLGLGCSRRRTLGDKASSAGTVCPCVHELDKVSTPTAMASRRCVILVTKF